ncbi:MAG: HEAT repeat domain-containing protein, partial [Candidatus Ozemobacteraceae bacterium]
PTISPTLVPASPDDAGPKTGEVKSTPKSRAADGVAEAKKRALYGGILLLVLAILGWLLPKLLRLFEALEWMKMEGLLRRFPRLALWRMERRISRITEREKRIHLFEMLTKAAVGAKNSGKVAQYGEELYDLVPRNGIALENLGKLYLSLSVWNPKQVEIVAIYATMHPDDQEILKIIVEYVKNSNDLNSVLAPHLLRHLELTGDEELASFIRTTYLEKPCSSFGREGLNLFEILTREHITDQVLGKLWQCYLATGFVDKAHEIAKNAGFEGNIPVTNSLLEIVEREASAEEKIILKQIRTTRGEIRVRHIQALLQRGYFTDEHGSELIALLESLLNDTDASYRYASQKILNHLHDVQKKVHTFRVAIGIPGSASVPPTSKKSEKKGVEKRPEKVAPTAGAEGISLPGQAPAKLRPVALSIIGLNENSTFNEIFALAKRSKVTDIPAWGAFLQRKIPVETLALILKCLGVIHARELTPLLLKYLLHSNRRVQANVIESLEENGDPSVISHLIPFMDSPDNRIRANAVKALHNMKVEQADIVLRQMAEDAQSRMRDSAIFVLRCIKLPWTALLLQKLLTDPESYIRIQAIKALAAQNLPGNLEILRQHSEGIIPLEDKDALEEALRKLEPKMPEPSADQHSTPPLPPEGPAAGT